MIQGPPGCGKSTCIALHAINLPYTSLKVLICTRDNATADKICEILLDQEEHESSHCKYCRVVGKSYKECVSDYVLPIYSHNVGQKKSDSWDSVANREGNIVKGFMEDSWCQNSHTHRYTAATEFLNTVRNVNLRHATLRDSPLPNAFQG